VDLLFWVLSIPQVAFSPETDHFKAATFPPQICVARETCNPENRMSIAKTMEKAFFIVSNSKRHQLYYTNIQNFFGFIKSSTS